MAKKKITWELYSYGIYSNWDKSSKALPKLLKITDQIPITHDVEFGLVIKIKGAKGNEINFRVDHPKFKTIDGKPAPPFKGEYFVNSNDYEFFLGDTVWEPIEDKAGRWHFTVWMNDEKLVEKTLYLFNKDQGSN